MLEYVPSTSVPGQQFSSSLEESDVASGGPLPHSNVYPRVVTQVDSLEDTLETEFAMMSNCEKWNIEQINDFVRKLGFLDTEKEGGDKIKLFLHISEVVALIDCIVWREIFEGENFHGLGAFCVLVFSQNQ